MSSSPLPRQEYVTPAQFVELSTLSIATVYRYLRAGRLPRYQPAGRGGRVLIPKIALQTYVLPSTVSEAPASAIVALPSSSVSNVARAPGPSPRWMKPREPKEGA